MLLKLFLKEATTPKAIADSLNITKGRVTAIMNSLKKKGYIDVEKNQFDGRSFELVLTEAGIIYTQDKLVFIDNYFEALLNHLGMKQSKTLVETLGNLLVKINEFEDKNNG